MANFKPYKQSYTVAAASLTGHASNVTGDTWVVTTDTASDGLCHKVTVRNDSVTDHAAKTIVLTGIGGNGEPISETITAPGVSATVTSTKFYKQLLSAVPSATIGADTFDIGWTAEAVTPWLGIRSAPSVVAVIVGGTINYDIEYSYEQSAAEANDVVFTAESSKTAKIDHVFTGPLGAARVHVNSHTSGTFTVHIIVQ